MSDYPEDDTEGIKALRKQFKEQKALLAEQRALIEELRAERSANGIADFLASNGLDPRVAKFYPKDAGTDPESVAKWVDENKDIFGDRRIAGSDGNTDSDTLTDAEMRGYQAIQDMNAYNAAVQMDIDSQLKSIKFDPQNPQASQDAFMAKLAELQGKIHT